MLIHISQTKHIRKMTNSPIPVNPEGGRLTGLRGQILTFKADPFLNNEEKCYDYFNDGLVIIQDGHIVDVGNYPEIAPKYPQLGQGDIDTYEDSAYNAGIHRLPRTLLCRVL